jgi:hypothetical protein
MVGAFVLLGAAAIVGGTMGPRGHLGAVRPSCHALPRGGRRGVARTPTSWRACGPRGRSSWGRRWVASASRSTRPCALPADPVVLLASSLVGDWQAVIAPRDAAPGDAHVRRQLAEAAGERGVVPAPRCQTLGSSRLEPGASWMTLVLWPGGGRGVRRHRRPRVPRGDRKRGHITAQLAATSEAVRRTAVRADSASADGEFNAQFATWWLRWTSARSRASSAR